MDILHSRFIFLNLKFSNEIVTPLFGSVYTSFILNFQIASDNSDLKS